MTRSISSWAFSNTPGFLTIQNRNVVNVEPVWVIVSSVFRRTCRQRGTYSVRCSCHELVQYYLKTHDRAENFTSKQHSRYPLDVLLIDRLCLSVRSGLVIHSLEQINRDTLLRCSSRLKTDRSPGLTRMQPTNRFIGLTILSLTQL